jgi:hypothetical protein
MTKPAPIETGPDGGMVLRTGEWRRQYDAIPALMAARAKAEQQALADFLRARIAEFPEAERAGATTGDLADDLRRRLEEAARTALADPERFVLLRSRSSGDPRSAAAPDEAPEIMIPGGGRDGSDVCFDVISLEAWIYLSALSDVWPDVLRAWRDRGRTFRLPAPLVMGDGALAPLFGRRFRQRGRGREAPPFTVCDAQKAPPGDTRVRGIELRSEQRQLHLWTPGVVRLTNPTGDEIVSELARVLDNGAWRALLCCFAAAQEDVREGKAPAGAFLYTPTRFADLLGIRRVFNGTPSGRVRQEHVEMLDSRLETLGAAGFEATVSVKGKPFKVEADRLVYYAHTKIAEGGEPERPEKRDKGRRPALLYRINDGLLRLLSTEGTWWFPLRVSVLAAPDGVPQSTWDDALKVFVLLCAKGKAEHARAKSPDALPWVWTLDGLLEQANVAGENRAIRDVRVVGRALLAHLNTAGLVRHELVGDGHETRIRYDLPHQRSGFATIPGRVLPARRGK